VLGGTPGEIEELQDLWRFDEATLDLNQTSLYASAQPIENLTLFTAFNYDDYNYPASEFGLPPPPGKTSVWTATGRNQSNNVDFGTDIAIARNRILPRPSHLKLQATYTIGENRTDQAGDTAAAAAAISYPIASTQFQELMVQYQYDLRDNVAINIGYYFTHYGESNFMVDNMENYMPTASKYSTFLGNTDIAPYDANVGFITLKFKF
jgi:hypothetical protein